MDATPIDRESLAVRIGGRQCDMYRPTSGQVVALRMAESSQLPADAKLGAVSEMFLSLFADAVDRSWFVQQLASGAVPFDALLDGLKTIVAGGQDTEQPEAPKRRARPRSIPAA